MSKRTEIAGTAVPIRGNDIDTDRIIPARFLKEITFDRMGDYLFYDVRFDQNHQPKNHPLNDPRYKQASIMIVGRNFGCGSSREHAPQSIMRYGIQAIVGESFAEIFAGNCKSLGVPAVIASADDIEMLFKTVETAPDTRFMLNLETMNLWFNDTFIPVTLSDAARTAFLNGTWNELGILKANADKIRATAQNLPYIQNFS